MTQRFPISDVVAILERTPGTLCALLEGLPEPLVTATEGDGTWSPYDVVGHLIHGERTDWIPRARHILAGRTEPFEPFDRTAQFTASRGKSLTELLDIFGGLRRESVRTLIGFRLTEDDLERSAMHPELGRVTLGELLATWATHDFDHIAQIVRIMAKFRATATGPWSAYLSILQDRQR